jgi:hypothetical protein
LNLRETCINSRRTQGSHTAEVVQVSYYSQSDSKTEGCGPTENSLPVKTQHLAENEENNTKKTTRGRERPCMQLRRTYLQRRTPLLKKSEPAKEEEGPASIQGKSENSTP